MISERNVGIVVTILVVGFGIYVFKARDERIKREAASRARIERDSAELVDLRQKLNSSIRTTDSTRKELYTINETYDRLRKGIDAAGIRPKSTTVIVRNDTTFVLDTVFQTDTFFLKAADDSKQACVLLDAACAAERLVAKQNIANLTRQNEELKKLTANVKTPFKDKLLILMGGVILGSLGTAYISK